MNKCKTLPYLLFGEVFVVLLLLFVGELAPHLANCGADLAHGQRRILLLHRLPYLRKQFVSLPQRKTKTLFLIWTRMDSKRIKIAHHKEVKGNLCSFSQVHHGTVTTAQHNITISAQDNKKITKFYTTTSGTFPGSELALPFRMPDWLLLTDLLKRIYGVSGFFGGLGYWPASMVA